MNTVYFTLNIFLRALGFKSIFPDKLILLDLFVFQELIAYIFCVFPFCTSEFYLLLLKLHFFSLKLITTYHSWCFS